MDHENFINLRHVISYMLINAFGRKVKGIIMMHFVSSPACKNKLGNILVRENQGRSHV